MQPLGPLLEPKIKPEGTKKRDQKRDPQINNKMTQKGSPNFTKNRFKSALFWGPFLRSLLDPFGEPQERPKRAQEGAKRAQERPKRRLRELKKPNLRFRLFL